ncbi:hypothetical protein LINGRAHAP2_LOCUS34901, partial [Linum grandiflorum]
MNQAQTSQNIKAKVGRKNPPFLTFTPPNSLPYLPSLLLHPLILSFCFSV